MSAADRDTLDEIEPLDAEYTERFRLASPSLACAVFDAASTLLKREDERGARIEAKASALFGATSLSLTLAFTFGASTLLAHPDYFARLPPAAHIFTVAVFAVALACGVTASFFALLALRVREDLSEASEEALFNAETLALADARDDEAEGLRDYQRFAAVHLVEVTNARGTSHDRKAADVRNGQRAFFGFVVALFAIGLVIAFAALGAPTTEAPHVRQQGSAGEANQHPDAAVEAG